MIRKNRAMPVDLITLENEILPHVFKPGRYLGLEQGAYRKPFDQAKANMVFVFPDLYEIGISNYGIKLLYSIVNQHPDYLCDRAYAFAPDMREKMATHHLPLYGLEAKMPLAAFDLAAFSLQYELNYTTILGVLESAQMPLKAKDRSTLDYPILIAGGPGSGNPMPLSPFFDAFIIGDGEDILIEILDQIKHAKTSGWDKPRLMDALGAIEGIFIPGKTQRAYKRIIDIAEKPVELAPLVPSVASIHDRVTIEARRGCDRMCRFCQPCFINLPVREQSIETIKTNALKELEKTGYEECSLLSLSIADYSYFKPLVLEVTDALKEYGASLSLSSQRADRFSVDVAEAVNSVRKSTLTFAPEAGTERMRNVINKNLSDAEILNAVTSAYQGGWNKVKLYFMIGLPTETNADLDGIVDIIRRMMTACSEIKRDKTKSFRNHLEVNVTLSNFVPKPHTPFQWFPQDSMAMLNEKIAYLKNAFRGMKGVKLNFTDPEISKLEAVISKGGPELAVVIEQAYQNGAYLDAWDDILNFQKWFDALQECGIDYEAYTRERLIDVDEPLPWDPIDMGLDKQWLKGEYRRATQAAATIPCFEACSTCGVCATYSTWPKFIETPASQTGLVPRLTVRSVLRQETPAELKTRAMKKLPVAKVRLKIEKKGKLRFVSHLDWLRVVQRAVLKAKLPVAYSQGFNPKPRISFSPALPLFMESLSEYIDIDVIEPVNNVLERLNCHLPPEGQVVSEALLPPHSPSIDKQLHQVNYAVRWTCKNPAINTKIKNKVLDLTNENTLSIRFQNKKQQFKVFDIAPYLSSLSLHDDEGFDVTFNLKEPNTGQFINIKPEWLLNYIEEQVDEAIRWSVTRTHLVLNPAG